MQYVKIVLCVLLCIISLTGCGDKKSNSVVNSDSSSNDSETVEMIQKNDDKKETEQLSKYTLKSKVMDVISDSVFGSYGTGNFGEKDYPAPATVILQYTGLSEVTGNEPPTYACVGTSDGIASYRSMERYIANIKRNGTNAKIEVFKGLSHGFGLGEKTVAKNWLNNAVDFWENNMK